MVAVLNIVFFLQGPTTPDVFQTPDPDKTLKLSEYEKTRLQTLKESIIRLIDEVRLLILLISYVCIEYLLYES